MRIAIDCDFEMEYCRYEETVIVDIYIILLVSCTYVKTYIDVRNFEKQVINFPEVITSINTSVKIYRTKKLNNGSRVTGSAI